jgi:hypothetical protein
MLLARSGALDEAVALIDDRLALTRTMDDPNVHAETLAAAAEVRGLLGRGEEADTLRREALRVFEQKGNVLAVRKLRELVS